MYGIEVDLVNFVSNQCTVKQYYLNNVSKYFLRNESMQIAYEMFMIEKKNVQIHT